MTARKSVAVEREGSCGSRLARIDGPSGSLSGRVIAKVSRRRQASNKPAKRTSKKVAGASERWPSSVSYSGLIRGGGRANRRPDTQGCGGQRLRPGLRFQGGALSTARRSAHRQRCVGRVLRAVKGDGCMGRAPADRRRLGPSKRSPFIGEVVEAVLAALERRGCAAHLGGAAGTGEGSLRHVESTRGATETSEVRSHRRRGKNIPTPAGRIPAGHAPMSIRRSGLGGVNHPFPRVNRPASQESSRMHAPQGV